MQDVLTIPLRCASGIVPNSLWLLDSSTYVSSFVSLALNECHYDLRFKLHPGKSGFVSHEV
jgi:hypothetical protein